MNTATRPLRLMLATAALALAAGALQTVHAAPHGGPGGMGPMNPQHVERMLDAVNASADQKSQVKAILEAARSDLQGQREAARSLHEQQMAVFTQPTVDARAAEALRQQMLAQHDASSKRMLQAMLDVSRVLTPEQRQQLADRMKQRRAAMEQRDAGRPAR